MRYRLFTAIGAVAALAFGVFVPSAVAVDDAVPGGWNEEAAQIELPDTVPSFDAFTETSGTWKLAQGARVVADNALAERAELLSTELTTYLGESVPAVSGVIATDQDVQLVLDAGRTDLGNEGFELRIGESGVVITAAQDAGVFYGTRTLSQLLRQEERGEMQLVLPGGTGISVPKYQERGVILCACQINISPEWIDRFLTDIADLHINQVLMEMKVKSDKYPDTNTWGYYTKQDVEQFVQKAEEYNIDVIPEINSPGHMNIWLENSPQYQLVDSNGNYHPDQLDISNAQARQLYKDLIDEYDGVFNSDYWHMGADEYTMTGGYNLYPQLTRYAQEKFGASATADDAFNAFINEVNEHVKAKGKTLRVFNDGVKRSASQKIDTDVVVDYWLNSNHYTPQQFVEDGYKLMNTTQSLYWSRQMAYGVNPQSLYNNGWNAATFDGNKKIDPDYEGLLGARISLWPDNAYMTENEVQMQTADSIAFLAQMAWSDSHPWPQWEGEDGMKSAIDTIGHATVRPRVAGADLPAGTYAFGELASLSSGPWQITPTYDDYYQVRDTASGKCLSIDLNAAKHLSTVTEVGAPAVLADCKDMSVQWQNRSSDKPMERTHQKWQIVQRTADKVSLRNAITNQYLAVATGNEKHVDIQGVSAEAVANNPELLTHTISQDGNHLSQGTVAQLPFDLVSTNGTFAENALFTMARKMGMSADPAIINDVDPTTYRDVTITLFAPSGKDVPESTVSVETTTGWKALPDAVKIPAMKAGASATAVFRIQNTTSTEGTAEFSWVAGDTTVTTNVQLRGVVGPRLCGGFTDISASSEETSGEGPVNGHISAAFDTNDDGTAKMDTFWHTRWSNGNDSFPFWVVFNPTTALDGNYMTTLEYAPRQNKVNGRIKSYNVYLSQTAKGGNEDWGEPVLSGELRNSTDWQTITMPENTEGQFVKFEITDVWDEVEGREDSFAAAAGFCVASAVKPIDIVAPAQPENPVTEGESSQSSTPSGQDTVVPIALAVAPEQVTGSVHDAIDPIAVDITVDKTKGYVLSFGPDLPQGLTYDAARGEITGTADTPFDGDIEVTLTQGEQTISKTIHVVITSKAITPDVHSNVEPNAADPVSCTVAPYAYVDLIDGVDYTISVTGTDGTKRTVTPDDGGKVAYDYGETISITATAKASHVLPSQKQEQTWVWTAPTKESLRCEVQSDGGVPAPNAGGESANNNQYGNHSDQGASQSSDHTDHGVLKLATTGSDLVSLWLLVVALMTTGGVLAARRRVAAIHYNK